MFTQFLSRSQVTSVASAGSVRNAEAPICQLCGKSHGGECRIRFGACFRCGSFEHRVRDYPRRSEFNSEPLPKSMTTSQKNKKSSGTSDIS